MEILKLPEQWWKLYCGKEFISFLGFCPSVKGIIKIDELHATYQIDALDIDQSAAYGKLIKKKVC